jgi:hypothetical protein
MLLRYFISTLVLHLLYINANVVFSFFLSFFLSFFSPFFFFENKDSVEEIRSFSPNTALSLSLFQQTNWPTVPFSPRLMKPTSTVFTGPHLSLVHFSPVVKYITLSLQLTNIWSPACLSLSLMMRWPTCISISKGNPFSEVIGF